jgi:hypothetical protein
MRKLKRLVAKYNMRKKGIKQFCKKKGGSSFFSQHWKEYIR